MVSSYLLCRFSAEPHLVGSVKHEWEVGKKNSNITSFPYKSLKLDGLNIILYNTIDTLYNKRIGMVYVK